VFEEVIAALNQRTQHRLQGFAQVFEWRDAATGAWRRLGRDGGEPPAGAQLSHRREAPAEKFVRQLGALRAEGQKFAAVPVAALYALNSDKFDCTLRHGKVVLKHNRLGADEVVFEDLQTAPEEKWERAKFTGFLAHDQQTLHLLTPAPELKYALSLPRRGRAGVLDEAAQGKQAGAVARARQALYDEAAVYLAPANNRLREIKAHNDAVLARAETLGAAMQSGERLAKTSRAHSTAEDRRAAEEILDTGENRQPQTANREPSVEPDLSILD
jgi:hypothetical protein